MKIQHIGNYILEMEIEDKNLENMEFNDKKVDGGFVLPKIPCLCCGETNETTFRCLHPSFIKIETLFLEKQNKVWNFPNKWICSPCYRKNSKTK
jgi:hypothetical protein